MIFFKSLILSILLLIATEQTFGQKDLFAVGAILGVNFAAQPIETNSNNNGLNTGLFCNANMNDHFNIKMEILYSRNGSYFSPEYFPKIQYGKINLDFLEVPIHFDFYINSLQKTKFLPDWTLEIGGAYTNLFNYYYEDINQDDVTDKIVYKNKNALLFQFGTTIFFSKHFGANIRWSKTIHVFNKNGILDYGGSSAIRLIYRM